jgi:DNA-binding transcriptional ArsR family regulator
MVTDGPCSVPEVFAAVADPIRRGILDRLRHGELSAGALAREFPVSRPAVSRHVRVLRDAGLVRLRRERQTLHYSLNPAPLAEIDRWLSGYRVFWGARLQDLRKYVEERRDD